MKNALKVLGAVFAISVAGATISAPASAMMMKNHKMMHHKMMHKCHMMKHGKCMDHMMMHHKMMKK